MRLVGRTVWDEQDGRLNDQCIFSRQYWKRILGGIEDAGLGALPLSLFGFQTLQLLPIYNTAHTKV